MAGCLRCHGPQYRNSDGDPQCLWCGEIVFTPLAATLGKLALPKAGRGRPTLLTSHEIATLLQAYDRGASVNRLAQEYGLCRTTLRGYLSRAGRKEPVSG